VHILFFLCVEQQGRVFGHALAAMLQQCNAAAAREAGDSAGGWKEGAIIAIWHTVREKSVILRMHGSRNPRVPRRSKPIKQIGGWRNASARNRLKKQATNLSGSLAPGLASAPLAAYDSYQSGACVTCGWPASD
jgi:hypothetical protein